MAQATRSSSLAKLSTPAKVGVGVLLVFLVGLLYWVVFYSDVSAKINAAQNAQSRLRSELATQQQNEASYLLDKDELATHQQRQASLNKALPEHTEAPAFLSALQQVANVSGVDLRAWQPMEEQTQTFYAKFPMKLELAGRFHQIAKFAYEAGKVERIINIENIEMADPKLDGDEVKVKAKCLATTFHSLKAKPPAPRGSAGQAPQAPPAAPPGGKK